MLTTQNEIQIAAPIAASRPRWEGLRHIRYILLQNPLTLVAAILFVLLTLAAIVGPALVPYDPLASDSARALQPPSWRHFWGTDQLGRDVFSRSIVATRLDLSISVVAVLLSFAFGSLLGATAGYFGGWTDRIVGRLLDTIMAFPLFVLAMGIVAALGNTIENIVYATAIINVPFYARMARAEVNVRREAGFVLAARLSGNGDWRILGFHIFPNALPPMMVQISLNMGWAILNAAGLSFIGLGVRPPTPEWGIMIAEGANTIISGEWWMAVFPGLMLMLAVLTFNLLGDGLRDIVDPLKRT
jgi:peptide/nickel transport system permease protein